MAFLDAQAAIYGTKNRHVPNIAALVHAALVRFEPEQANKRQQDAKQRRGVRFDYQPDDSDGVAGSATLTATLDLVDAHDLDNAVAETANQLAKLGDQATLETRRARALGMLAHPQQVLDLFEKPTPHRQRTDLATTAATVYLHIDTDDLRSNQDGDTSPGTLEKLGSATLDLIHD